MATLFACVAFAALRNASPLWAESLFTASVVLLIGSVLVAANTSGERRAFWIGYATLSAAHMFFSWSPDLAKRDNLRGSPIVTTRLSESLYERLRPQLTISPIMEPSLNELVRMGAGPVSVEGAISVSAEGVPSDGRSVVVAAEDGYYHAFGPGPFIVPKQIFVLVARCLWTISLGFVGGYLSQFLHHWFQNRDQDQNASPPR